MCVCICAYGPGMTHVADPTVSHNIVTCLPYGGEKTSRLCVVVVMVKVRVSLRELNVSQFNIVRSRRDTTVRTCVCVIMVCAANGTE